MGDKQGMTPVLIDDDGSGGVDGTRRSKAQRSLIRLCLFIPKTVTLPQPGQPLNQLFLCGSISTVTVTFKGSNAQSAVTLSNVFRGTILAAGPNNSAPVGVTIETQNSPNCPSGKQVVFTPDDPLTDEGEVNGNEEYDDRNSGNIVSAVFESRSSNGLVEMHHYMPAGGGQISFTINVV